jgi:hypothetical protein
LLGRRSGVERGPNWRISIVGRVSGTSFSIGFVMGKSFGVGDLVQQGLFFDL